MKNTEIVTIENFLTDDECDKIIGMIDNHHTPSYVDGGKEISTQNPDYRTSSTCMLDESNSNVSSIKKRIADFLKVDINKGQQLEGQLYEPGQFFKENCDWFEGESYINHALSSGNRTHTFMIYLNEPEEGGETNFPELDQSIKPKKGMALVWENLNEDGSGNTDFLYECSEVKLGKQYIITSWWRENEYNPIKDSELSKEYWNNISSTQSVTDYLNSIGKSHNDYKHPKTEEYVNTFSSYDDVPRFTPTGFKVVKCPPEIWGLIKDSYELLKEKKEEEYFQGKDEVILGIGNTSDIFSFHHIPSIRDHIHKLLQPLHEEWSGQRLEPSVVYGIRSYNKGAVLIEHRDRIETHHIASIIIVDKDIRCGCKNKLNQEIDWPLNFQDHNGKRHRIFAEPGDMILYESIACRHGRIEPFQGNYFRNFYVHYKLSDWEYVGPANLPQF